VAVGNAHQLEKEKERRKLPLFRERDFPKKVFLVHPRYPFVWRVCLSPISTNDRGWTYCGTKVGLYFDNTSNSI
jgi:hypothetical protein